MLDKHNVTRMKIVKKIEQEVGMRLQEAPRQEDYGYLR